MADKKHLANVIAFHFLFVNLSPSGGQTLWEPGGITWDPVGNPGESTFLWVASPTGCHFGDQRPFSFRQPTLRVLPFSFLCHYSLMQVIRVHNLFRTARISGDDCVGIIDRPCVGGYRCMFVGLVMVHCMVSVWGLPHEVTCPFQPFLSHTLLVSPIFVFLSWFSANCQFKIVFS